MISSPGCVCLMAGASGSSSTRLWMTSRPGTLRSMRWRSLRRIPGTCGLSATVPTPFLGDAHLVAVRLEERGQRREHLVGSLLGQPMTAREDDVLHVVRNLLHGVRDHVCGGLRPSHGEHRHRQALLLPLLVL